MKGRRIIQGLGTPEQFSRYMVRPKPVEPKAFHPWWYKKAYNTLGAGWWGPPAAHRGGQRLRGPPYLLGGVGGRPNFF